MDTITVKAKAQEITSLALPLIEAIKKATVISDPPMVVGIFFSCPDGQRKEFVQEWAQEMEAWAAGLDEEANFTLLVVSLEACGGQATYRTADDVPLVDVPCPCGDPNHWLVKWRAG